MLQFIADLRVLLKGCLRQLGTSFALSVGSSILDVVCMLILPAFLMVVLSGSSAMLPNVPVIGASLSTLSVGGLFASVVLLFLVRAAYMLIVGASIARVAESVRGRVVTRLMQGYLNSTYEVAIAGPMSARITAALAYSQMFSANVVLPLFRLMLDLLTIATILCFLAIIQWRLVIVLATVLLLVGIGYFLVIRGTARQKSIELARHEVELTHHITQSLSAPREVRIYNLSDYFTGKINKLLGNITHNRAWIGAVYWFPRALGELTLICLALGYMVLKAWSGEEIHLVVSSLSVLGFAGLRLLPAFAQSMSNVSMIQSGRRVSQLLADHLRTRLFQQKIAPAAVTRGSHASLKFETLELQGVCFSYAGTGQGALKNIEFTVRRGQSVGIIGPSGAGKSTLGDLLLGLLEPTRGEIRVNGQGLSLSAREWQQVIGFVPQAPFLTNDTLQHNIAFGTPHAEIDLDRLQRAIRLAQLESVVNELPQGIDAMLGDNGIRLSGGQRQRVAIARALYYERDFLLLDEATSALDPATENEIIRAIASLKGQITTVVIAHRTTTLRDCDLVIEMREGQIVSRQITGR